MQRLVALLFVVFTAVLASCAEPVQPALDVTPTARTLVPGDRVQLTVTRRFAGGTVEDVTNKVSYTTSDKTIATVDRGLLTVGISTGSVLVRVLDPSSDATAVATFTVVPAAIQSIDVSPSPAIVMPKGTQRQFTATAHLTNGTTKDVTAQVLWSSTNEAAASVGNTAGDKGVVIAVASGDTTILATDNESRVQGRSTVFVTSGSDLPTLTAIVVTPNPGAIAVTKTKQFEALGVLSDGSTRDMTREVTWTSAVPAIATIDPLGVATGVSAGATTITATGPEPNIAIKGSAAATVSP
jgi:hypothetical protein